MRRFAHFAALLVAGTALPALAAPDPAAGYGDHMVLQRGQPIVIGGTATPGGEVRGSLSGSGGSETVTTRVDADGQFRLTFAAREGSADPLTLTLADATGQTVLSDLVVGDVWLCSGQSNMELSVSRALNTWNELRMAADPQMRLLMVPKYTAAVEQAEFGETVAWRAATPETVEPFSAACFFMGKRLRAENGVPVGLIHSNWGGSGASAWMSPSSVRTLYGPEAANLLDLYERDPFAAAQAFVPQWYDWWANADGGREPWADPDSLSWQPIPRFSFWNYWEGTGLDTQPAANVWLRQRFTLTAEQARSGGTLSIGAIDDLDLTWVNGQPVGYTFGWGVERHYRVPAEYLHAGENEILIAASNNWDTGGFFAGPDRLFFESGNGATVPLGADWEYSVGAVTTMPPRAPWDAIEGMGVMHNAMIAPLGPMRLAGVAWYQGEADVGKPGYDIRLVQLFRGWRRQFGDPARMLVVQLANYGQRTAEPVESGWAVLREEQRQGVLADGNAALVTAIDIGEPTDIHPANKNVLGRRLAMAAQGQGLPMPIAALTGGEVPEGMLAVSFDGVEGSLRSYGGPALSFELCGPAEGSCRFVPGTAQDNAVFLPLDGRPVTRIRYAWSDAPTTNLFDQRDVAVPGFEIKVGQ